MNYFYNRTAYRFNGSEIPKWFIALDVHYNSTNGAYPKELVLAENICRRMADIEWYAKIIEDNLNLRKDLWSESILIGTNLVSYYMSCKALFDAVAITLNYLYNLKLSQKEQDFSKPKFWNTLSAVNNKLHKEYFSFKSISDSIKNWRDYSIYRVTPIVILVGPGDRGQIPDEAFNIMLINELNADMNIMVNKKGTPKFVHPLYHHKKWKKTMLKLCDKICEDIINSQD